MRSTTAPEQTVLQSRVRAVALKVEVENAGASYVDLSQYAPGATVEVDVDRPVHQATVSMARASGATKFSPLLASTLDLSRGLKLWGSTVAPGGALNYKLIFQGYITQIDWQGDPLVITATGSPGGRLSERWIEEEAAYGSDDGVAIETVMAAIVDAWSDEAISAPISPGFLISPKYTQQRMSIWDALAGLASLIGWTVRERINAGGTAYEAVLEEPDRTPASTMWTFGADDVLDVARMELDRDPLRNVVRVSYTDAAAGERAFVEAPDAAGITRDGRLWMELEQAADSPIDTEAEAQALADAALADLSEPPATFEHSVQFFWPIELDDFYRFTALTDLFPSSQDWAVTGYTHDFPSEPGGMAVTRIRVRGKPQGYYRKWHETGGETHRPSELAILSVEFSADPSGAGQLMLRTSLAVHSATMHVRQNIDPTDDDILSFGLHAEVMNGVLSVAGLGRGFAGETLHLGLIGWSDAEGLGARTATVYAKAPIQAKPLNTAPKFELTPSVVGTAARVKAILVNDPDGAMLPYGDAPDGAYVLFRRTDTGAEQTDDTPTVVGPPRPEYENATTYNVAAGSVEVEVFAYYWRTRAGDPVELFLGRITLSQNPLAEVSPGYADWGFTGKINYYWKYDAQTTSIRFAARRSAPWPNNAATRNLLIAGGTDLLVATYGDPTQATLTFPSADDNPRPGESIYIAAIGWDGSAWGPLSVGQTTREFGLLGEAFSVGGHAQGREIPAQINPVTGEEISGTPHVQYAGYPFISLGGRRGAGISSARIKVSRTAMPADELAIDGGVMLTPLAVDIGPGLGIDYTDHGWDVTFDDVNPGPADAHAKAIVAGRRLVIPFGPFVEFGAELQFTDLLLAGPHERLYVRAWPSSDPLGLTDFGSSVATIIYGPDATLSMSFADWREQASRAATTTTPLVSEFYLAERGLAALNYARHVLVVSADSGFSGDVYTQVVYRDSADAVVQPGNPYVSATLLNADLVGGPGRIPIEIRPHQIPAGAVRAQVYVHISDGSYQELIYGSYQAYLREAPSPTGAGVVPPAPTTYEQAVQAAAQAAGGAVAAALAYSSTDETGAAVVAAPLMDVTNTIPLITAERAATPDLNVGPGAYSDDETLDDIRAVIEADVAQAILDASDAQATADGKVVTFIQTSAPTAEGVGDLWFDSDDGNKVYRWSGSAWVNSTASGVVGITTFYAASAPTALAVGDLWFDSDDGNKVYRWNGSGWVNTTTVGAIGVATFLQTSAPTPGAVGDLWVDTDDSNKMYRWSGSAWDLTRDSGIPTALSDAAAAQSTATSAGTLAATKIVSFFATSAPTATATGDLWFDSDDNNKSYRWNGSSWVSTRDAGKATTFYGAAGPTADAIGDIWFDSDDSNKQYRWNGSGWASVRDAGKTGTFYATSAPTAEAVGDVWFYTYLGLNTPYRWNGSAWVSVQDATIAAAQSTATSAGSAASAAQSTANSRITTFYATSAPTALATGDIWFDSDDNNKQYRWNGSAWAAVRDAFKVTTFYATSAPTAEATGDIWFDTDDDMIAYRWSGSTWVPVRDLGIGIALGSMGTTASPLPPAGYYWSPSFRGGGTGVLADGNISTNHRIQWVPFRFSISRQITELQFRTGAITGSPDTPLAQVLIATLHANMIQPATVVYSSAEIDISAPSTLFTQTGVNFTPVPGTWYVYGVKCRYGSDPIFDYVTVKIWDDPLDTSKLLPVVAAGGGGPQSASIITGSEPAQYQSANNPQGWIGAIVAYSARPIAGWLKV